MQKGLKWMLLGIFLALASIWCLLAGTGSVLLLAVGFYILPLLAVISFATGFTCDRDPTQNTSVPQDEEDKE